MAMAAGAGQNQSQDPAASPSSVIGAGVQGLELYTVALPRDIGREVDPTIAHMECLHIRSVLSQYAPMPAPEINCVTF